MQLKDFMKLHTKDDFDYEILLRRINQKGEKIHLDYADNYESPWERYFGEYLNWKVEYFKIEIVDSKICLVIYINYKNKSEV